MFFRQLAKIRSLVEYKVKKGEMACLTHPAHGVNPERKSVSAFFYHKTTGEHLFNGALLRFLKDKLRLQPTAPEFEFYFTAYHNITLFAEAADHLELLTEIRIMPSFWSKLTKKEIMSLKKEYYFAFLSLLASDGCDKEFCILTEGFFIHHFFGITYPTPVRRNVPEWCKSIIAAKHGSADALKESIRAEGKNVNFRLSVDGSLLVDLNGGSIKTLRQAAYKKLLMLLLDDRKE